MRMGMELVVSPEQLLAATLKLKVLSSFHLFFFAFMKDLLRFFFPQSKAFREIVSKCEVLVAMYSILYRCKCLSTLTKPFPNELQLHDCLLMKCMWDFKQHVKEKLHPQLKKPLHYLFFSPPETDLHTWELLWGVTIFGLLMLENAINSGSEFLWKRPVSFQLQQSVPAGAALQNVSFLEW